MSSPLPRTLHAIEQVGGALYELGKAVGEFHRGLLEAGMPEAEAWALTQRLEEKLTTRLLTDYGQNRSVDET